MNLNLDLDRYNARRVSHPALFAGASLSSAATPWSRPSATLPAARPATASAQEQRLQEVGTQAAKIAHDLNNMLSPILMALELFRPYIEAAGHEQMLEVARKSVVRASELSRQILSFASGAEAPRLAVDSRELIHEIARIAERTFPAAVAVEVKTTGELAPVVANATQIHQALLNLCINARDAMPAGGRLTLQASNVQIEGNPYMTTRVPRPGDYVLFEVSDTGSGIPEEIREKIFQPFFTTKAPGKGTGLGLASVRSIIEKHGGVLAVQTEIGRGTTFRFLLPAATPHRAEAA
jgi:signal transduction histidine kinase